MQGTNKGRLVRDTLTISIRTALPRHNTLLIAKGSVGQGTWARAPWVAVFNRLVTESAQKGFYPVYLFREDLAGVYLSLNQAMTEAKEQYRSEPKTALRARADNFRAMLGPAIKPFVTNAIDLAPSNSSNSTSFYEAGNICSVYYPMDQMPDESILVGHLRRVLDLYEMLVEVGVADNPDPQEHNGTFFEGGGGLSFHLKVERNRKLSAMVKRLKGTQCEACGMDFSVTYGDLGVGFIEAHHLIPIAYLKNSAVALDPKKDFAVLCANCHRMAHRMDDPGDIAGLRGILAKAKG